MQEGMDRQTNRQDTRPMHAHFPLYKTGDYELVTGLFKPSLAYLYR